MFLKLKFSKIRFLLITASLLLIFTATLSGLVYYTAPTGIIADTATDTALDNTYGPTGSLKLSPESGTLDNALSIEGDGFKPEEKVDIYFYKSESEKILVKSVTSDGRGEISLTFLNPVNLGTGTYKIVAEGSDKVLWADYYITSERRFSVLTFAFSIASAFVAGAGIMFLIMRWTYRKYLPKTGIKP
jgi:5-hydroxyisourate hydrolase-like protein (transthyretin family)